MSLNPTTEIDLESVFDSHPPAPPEFEEFRLILEAKCEQIRAMARSTVAHGMGLSRDDLADDIDHASSETAAAFEFRLRTREHQLLRKVLIALEKIDDGTFGECDDCGDEIGRPRLLARPEAPLCIACKMTEERNEGMSGEG